MKKRNTNKIVINSKTVSKHPMFSIVTAVYNEVACVNEHVDGLLKQKYKDYEFLVVDGASKDGTGKAFQKRINDIDFLLSEPDKGIYDAMNKALRNAKGEWIYFYNTHDKFYDENTLGSIAKYLEELENSDIDLVYGFVRATSPSFKDDYRITKTMSQNGVKIGKKVSQQAVFMRTARLLQMGGFNSEYRMSADFDIYSRYFKSGGKALKIDVDIAYYDVAGRSSINLTKTDKENYTIIKRNFGIFWASVYWIIRRPFIWGPMFFIRLLGIKRANKIRRILGV